jgi:hypothetical protein
MSDFDYIHEARDIGRQLAGDDGEEWRERIEDAICYASVGSELAAQVKSVMSELVQSKHDLPPALVMRIKQLDQYLSQFFKHH